MEACERERLELMDWLIEKELISINSSKKFVGNFTGYRYMINCRLNEVPLELILTRSINVKNTKLIDWICKKYPSHVSLNSLKFAIHMSRNCCDEDQVFYELITTKLQDIIISRRPSIEVMIRSYMTNIINITVTDMITTERLLDHHECNYVPPIEEQEEYENVYSTQQETEDRMQILVMESMNSDCQDLSVPPCE